MKFLDQTKIYVASGKGGDGCVSFRREKYIEFGGPDGGNGGKGGDIIFHTNSNLNTLIDFRFNQHHKAKKGENGKGKNKTGKNGDSLVINVPIGTEIYNEDKSILYKDLVLKNQNFTLLKGGKGGLGNSHFKSSTNQAPRRFTQGEDLQDMWIWLSLKLFADIGIIGKPNAGKSSLLSKISAAQPKIGDYPFTTLHPVLGVIKNFEKEIVVADIPGIIEGAHEGKGLGDKFLAHIERCKALLHIIDCSDKNFLKSYDNVRNELSKYGKNIERKNEIIAISKIDLCEDEREITKLVKSNIGKTPFNFSSITKKGIKELITELFIQSGKNDY